MEKIRNSSIDLFRIVCAVMVIIIHTAPFSEINSNLSYIVTQIFPRVAVPFFYCSIGYFFIEKLSNNKKTFKNYFLKLLIIYIIWSGIYFFMDLFSYYINNLSFENFFTKTSLLTYIKDFFIFGSEYHLWFFPALFFGLILITICHNFNLLKPLAIFSILFYIIALLGSSYYELGTHIPFINTLIEYKHFNLIVRRVFGIAIPFLLQGYLLYIYLEKRREEKRREEKRRNSCFLLVVLYILFVLEILLLKIFNIQKNVSITIFLYPLMFIIMKLLINNPMPKFQKISIITRDIANFMYYSHPLFIFLISLFTKNVFNYSPTPTFSFVSAVLTTVIIRIYIVKNEQQVFKSLI